MRVNDIILQDQLPTRHTQHAQDILLRPAAVLLPLIPQTEGDSILFTLRSQKLRHHRGQISFPGGKKDATDESLQYTALRETHEEIGIQAEQIHVLGALPSFATHTGFYIYPFVGRLPWPVNFVPETAEIDEVFQVPVKHLRNPDIYHVEWRKVKGQNYPVHFYEYKHYTIWGITAHILHDFLNRI